MNEINKRIQIILHKFEDTRINFCNTTGINSFQLKEIFRNEKELSYNQIYMICKSYPQLNIAWFITGNGKILNGVENHELKINVRVTKNKKIQLYISREYEYNYRQVGVLLCNKVELNQTKSNLSEERALCLASYSFALDFSSGNKVDAYKLYKSIYSKYSQKASNEKLNSVVAFHLAFKYYCTTSDKKQLF